MVQPHHEAKHCCGSWPGGCWGLKGSSNCLQLQTTMLTAFWHNGKRELPLYPWPLLGSITCPQLVFHSRLDTLHPSGIKLARAILAACAMLAATPHLPPVCQQNSDHL